MPRLRALLAERIETIGLSIRCYRHLKLAGINAIADLVKAPDAVLAPYYMELLVGMTRLRRLRLKEEQGYDDID